MDLSDAGTLLRIYHSSGVAKSKSPKNALMRLWGAFRCVLLGVLLLYHLAAARYCGCQFPRDFFFLPGSGNDYVRISRFVPWILEYAMQFFWR